jgi:demethylmenaquinone methyltransferase/2-methoxy-6-polyprenyl-1,4-benzoquinol methylase
MHTIGSKNIQSLFDSIARRYDWFNSIATAGMDRKWRKEAVRLAAPSLMENSLDAATGTGRLAVELASVSNNVSAIDFSSAMIKEAVEYVEKQGLTRNITILQSDVLNLPFRSESFNCATIGFGLRNLPNIQRGLEELYRVLKPNSYLVILDIVRPKGFAKKIIYKIFFQKILPYIGWFLSGKRQPYQYLPNSVESYLSPRELSALMESTGFRQVHYSLRAIGSIALHVGLKNPEKLQ